MKKRLSLILACLLVFAMLAGCGGNGGTSGGTTSGDVIKIGVFQPLSGDMAAGGKQETLGIEYAQSIKPTVDIGGKTYTVELVQSDNASDTSKAPTAAANLVSAGVSAVIGSYGSGVSIAGSPTFETAGIPCLATTSTNPQVTDGNDHYFRICFLDPFQGTVLANYAYNELGVKNAYCLNVLGDDYSGGLVNYFIEAFTALGGQVTSDTFPQGNSDFTSYITNAKNAGAEVFFSPVYAESAQLIVDQFAGQGMTIPILAGDTWDSNVVLAAVSGTTIDLTITTFYPEGADASFDNGFKAWLNEDNTRITNNGGNDIVAAVSAMGYDGYMTILAAIENAGSTNPADILAALKTTEYTGVTGLIKFDDIGDAVRTTAYVKHANVDTGLWDALPAVSVDDVA
jgi:branched-chain amino acid transport system substrate-binding protein